MPRLVLGLVLGLVPAIAFALACSPDWHGGIHARMGWSETSGLRIVEVAEGGPAEEAGLQVDDRILEIDGEPVETLTQRQVVERLRGPVGSHVDLVIIRNGERQRVRVERAPYREQGEAGSSTDPE